MEEFLLVEPMSTGNERERFTTMFAIDHETGITTKLILTSTVMEYAGNPTGPGVRGPDIRRSPA
jgi:hypothetical protein